MSCEVKTPRCIENKLFEVQTTAIITASQPSTPNKYHIEKKRVKISTIL